MNDSQFVNSTHAFTVRNGYQEEGLHGHEMHFHATIMPVQQVTAAWQPAVRAKCSLKYEQLCLDRHRRALRAARLGYCATRSHTFASAPPLPRAVPVT